MPVNFDFSNEFTENPVTNQSPKFKQIWTVVNSKYGRENCFFHIETNPEYRMFLRKGFNNGNVYYGK